MEERANLRAFRTFVYYVLVWICQFPLPLGVWEGLRFVIMALPGLFFYLTKKKYARSGVNQMWTLKNSKELLQNLQSQ